MRRTVLALMAVAALAAGCQQPSETPAADPAPAAAPPPEMPADAPPQEEVDPAVVAAAPAGEPGSCLGEVGEAAAARLVQRCIAVSPATHPPCNAANPCAMIQGEIDRACEMYGPGEARPAECGA
ncbi:hypothetical protein [Brevundimonas sp.]|uniref:hypothetical protein n=1 Tax=Brevundimonas sp. TaxID=1871086 RepID=UPI002D53AE62|nr:hypothetical protein [Brevundimonas sp.]HYD28395.1 hypothetical protein [Brevundimonas sp.]